MKKREIVLLLVVLIMIAMGGLSLRKGWVGTQSQMTGTIIGIKDYFGQSCSGYTGSSCHPSAWQALNVSLTTGNWVFSLACSAYSIGEQVQVQHNTGIFNIGQQNHGQFPTGYVLLTVKPGCS